MQNDWLYCRTCGTAVAMDRDAEAVERVVPSTPTDPSWATTNQFQTHAPVPRPARTVWVVAGLVVVVALALTGVIVFRDRNGKVGAGSSPSTPTAPANGNDTTVFTTPTTGLSTTVSPTSMPSQLPPIDTSALDGNALAAQVGATLQAYFGGINSKNFGAAYAVLSPANQSRLSFTNFMNGSATSTDSAITVQSLQRNGDGSVVAVVAFTSQQDPAHGPRPGETCTVWLLAYHLVPGSASFAVSYLIDSVSPVGGGSRPC